jgi:putative ABC transport system substrate-binding protein
VVSIYRDFAEAGGLIAYGPNLNVVYRRAADYVAKLIKGEQPSNLPVEQPVRFELVVIMKSAQALGITIPQSVLGPRRQGDRIGRPLVGATTPEGETLQSQHLS